MSAWAQTLTTTSVASRELVLVSESGPLDEFSDVVHRGYVDGCSTRAVDQCRQCAVPPAQVLGRQPGGVVGVDTPLLNPAVG